jgi:uracil-DNA glycosylase family 4
VGKSRWSGLNERIVACRACPRLIAHCRAVAKEKRPAYRDWKYWGKPVPNFGDPSARLLIVGLAPGAHGANRTGRVFTGDSSGEWLYRALHKAGFANQATSHSIDDGLRLTDCAITGVAHCAPPQNKLLPSEIVNCRLWLEETIDILPRLRVFVALGATAWQALSRQAAERGWLEGRAPKFAHLAKVELAGGRWLVGSYHPSRQNTNTGVLTEAMLDRVFNEARTLLAHRGS